MFRLAEGPLWMPLAGGVFATVLAMACVTDLRSRRIPNGLVLGVVGLGVVLQGLGHGAAGLASAALGLLTGLAVWLPFWLLHMMGGGDVKLFAAGAAWLGPTRAVEGALVAGLVGGILALAWLLWTRGAALTAMRLTTGMRQPQLLRESTVDARDIRLPYALAMSAGLQVAWWFPGILLGGVT